MSESSWSSWLDLILTKIIEWGIPFSLGFLFRKRIGRLFVKTKMKILNETISIDVLSVRSYKTTKLKKCEHQIYENIKTLIPNTKLLKISPQAMRISVPTFGNLRITLEGVEDIDLENNETAKIVKIKSVIVPESPIRLGVRNVDQLGTFANYLEILFGQIEQNCLAEKRIISDSTYTIVEIPRKGGFREEKSFRITDESLSATVLATENKIEITLTNLSQIGKATKKYLLF